LALDAHSMLAGGGVRRRGPLAGCEAPDAGEGSQCARPGAAEVECACGAHQAATRERIPARRTRGGEAPALGIAARRTDERREPTNSASRPLKSTRLPGARSARRRAQMLCSPHGRASPRARKPARRSSTPGQRMRALLAPSPSPGRRTDCAGSFTTLPGRYRTQTRRMLPSDSIRLLRRAEPQKRRGAEMRRGLRVGCLVPHGWILLVRHNALRLLRRSASPRRLLAGRTCAAQIQRLALLCGPSAPLRLCGSALGSSRVREQSIDSVSPRWHGGCEVGQ
jgi:hypothetical protein